MPGIKWLIRIADASSVTLDWLATGREPKYRTSGTKPDAQDAQEASERALVEDFRASSDVGKKAIRNAAHKWQTRTKALPELTHAGNDPIF